MNRTAWTATLGGLLAVGWAAVAVAFVVTGSLPKNAGDALALAVVLVGTLFLAALNAVGARQLWADGSPRRASIGALCTVVVAGWPAITALSGGLDAIADPVGASSLALTALGGAILILLHRARMDAIADETDPALRP